MDLKRIMNYPLTSCLIFFFLFSFFHHLPCSSSKLESCDTLYHCGNITAGFPFWGVNRPRVCGHPLLQLYCFENFTSMLISNHCYLVAYIDQTSHIRLASAELLAPFCNNTFTPTSLPSDLFELLPNYKSLTVFDHCNPKLSYKSSYTCPTNKGLVSLSQSLDHTSSCSDSFTITVPKSYFPEEKELNITKLESVLWKGFEVKVKFDEKACQECSSSHGFCSFNDTTQFCCKDTVENCFENTTQVHPQTEHYPPYHATEPELHRRCSPTFSCGNQTDLFYPFWISGREECGHPDFKLECNTNTTTPEFSISSIKFKILESNFASRIIRLARSDYIDDRSCLQNSGPNAPFDESLLSLASGTEILTIYYSCHQDISSVSTFFGKLDCDDDDDDGRRYYFATSSLFQRNMALWNEYGQFCDRNFSTPASRPSLNTLQRSPTADNIRKALEEGFEIRLWQDCSTCLDAKGACGYNRSANGFTCYYITEPTKSSGKKAKAGIIGAASALAAVILIAVGVFCFIRRRRKIQEQETRYKSKALPITSSSSRETSTNPTSTPISSSSNHSLLPSISSFAKGSDYYGHGVQVFSYEELEEATNNFSRELGDGGFGTVYYGELKDGRAVAVKRLYERSLKRVEQFKNEIEILKSLKHPNLVILYGCTSRHSRELLLVYEYISNGTLADHLHGDRAHPRPLCWSVRLNIAIETAKALSFLHAKGIIHRDVKTTNILLEDNHQVKVADFGLSRLFPLDQTHISTAPQGTPGYVDPEYYQCYRLNEKSDVYSFGVVLTELISSKEAVDITRHRHDINLANMAVAKIQNDALHELVDPSLGFAKDPEVRRRMMSVAELAFRCLQQERDVRPSMDEIVEVLEGIKEENGESPDVVEIEVRGGGGDDVGLLRHSAPPPISPETDKWTSSSDTAASY